MSDRRIPRLFLERDLGSDRAPLTDREAKYLGKVLRLKRGDLVLAFNGRGQERYAAIASLARSGAGLALAEHVDPLPEPPLALTLVQAVAKTDAMDLIVQKATELGVHAIWPVTTDFSVVRLDAERAERRAAHWRRIAQSACEQCGRHRPPSIEQVQPLAETLEQLPPDGTRIVLDPRAEAPLASTPRPSSGVFLLVGPEGGFSAADLERSDRSDFVRMRFGPRTLRVETAAIAAAAWLQTLWGDMG